MELLFDENGFLKYVIFEDYTYKNSSHISYNRLGIEKYVDIKLNHVKKEFYFRFKPNSVGYSDYK